MPLTHIIHPDWSHKAASFWHFSQNHFSLLICDFFKDVPATWCRSRNNWEGSAKCFQHKMCPTFLLKQNREAKQCVHTWQVITKQLFPQNSCLILQPMVIIKLFILVKIKPWWKAYSCFSIFCDNSLILPECALKLTLCSSVEYIFSCHSYIAKALNQFVSKEEPLYILHLVHCTSVIPWYCTQS